MTVSRLRTRGALLGLGLLALVTGGLGACSDDRSAAGPVAPSTSTTPSSTPSGSTPPSPPDDALAPTATAPSSPASAATAPSATAPTADVVGQNTLAPVPMDAVATFSEGLQVRTVDRRATELTASAPGETGGPGVVLTLSFHNGTPDPVDLDGLRVSAFDATGAPVGEVDGEAAEPPSGLLAPGADAQGSFAFSLPTAGESALRLEITSTGSADVVVVTD